MANLKASLVWRCKTDRGWERFPVCSAGQVANHKRGAVVIAKNGRIPVGAVTIDGTVHEYKQGTFQLRTYEGRRVVYKPVKGGSGEAFAALEDSKTILKAKHEAKKAGLEVVDPDADDDNGDRLEAQRKAFLKRKNLTVGDNTVPSYEKALEFFFKICKKERAADLVKDDVLAFAPYMRKEGYHPGTIFLYYTRLMTFLDFAGIKKTEVPKKRERPQKPGNKPKPYSVVEIAKLFAAVDHPLYALAYEMYLKTGLRRRELAFIEWSDIDFDLNKVFVRNKPDLGFRTKSGQERSIPLMDPELRNKLAQWKQRHGDWQFVFGKNKGAKVNTQFLAMLKRFIRAAGLNCGHCATCRTKQKRCEHWTLHKFRHTFATTCVRKNINPRTLQAWLGHASLETTMKYLAALHDDQQAVEQMVNVFDDFATAPAKVIEMPLRHVG